MQLVDPSSVQRWRSSSEVAAEIATAFAELPEHATEVSVDEILDRVSRNGANLLRRIVTTELRKLENFGCGRLVTGRKGHKSRFISTAGLQKLGQFALGQPVKPVEPDNPDLICHRFALRPDLVITIPLPRDFSSHDVERLMSFLSLLPFSAATARQLTHEGQSP